MKNGKKAVKKAQDHPVKASSIRRRAEERLRQRQAGRASDEGEPGSIEVKRTLHELQVHQIELEMQNEELRQAQEELDASRTRYQDLYDLAPVGYFTISKKGLILEANLTAATLLGVSRVDMVKQTFTRFILPDDRDIYSRCHRHFLESAVPPDCDLRMMKKDGTTFWVYLTSRAVEDAKAESSYRVVMSDITKHKELEHRQSLANEIFSIINQALPFAETIHHILSAIKTEMGFDAVGLRLRSGDDYPYFVQNGFSDDFLLTENTLAVRDQNGDICRDERGNISLECTCGLVISGRTDPTNPLFTPGGSAWTNDSSELLGLSADQDRRLHPRNRCVHEGFRSVGIIPVRAKQKIIGLLQLNDREKDSFTLDMIQYFEYLSSSIGLALARNQAEEALQKAYGELDQKVKERTIELSRVNERLLQEIKEHKKAQESLQTALTEIKTMKDQLEAENVYFRQESKMKHPLTHILGQSDGLKYVLYRAEQVATANTTVLILGETGTGKELIAFAIHDMSPRKERPLVTVNCAALPGNLIESELFGREKGAFTGADSRQVGRFEIANGSTICLDEIGELPLELQAKLLRVIQHNVFERLGSPQTVKVDVRIIATTNRNLEEEVRKGRFRQDLYYRLNVFPITVPPLRQRKEDIPLMVQAFMERYARKLGKKITSIQKETLQMLQDYPWPGNVRELESIIERAVILCPGPVLHLADKLESSAPLPSSAVRTLEETERNQIHKILTETGWRIEGKSGAAAILGLRPSTLRARMHKLGIARPGKKETA